MDQKTKEQVRQQYYKDLADGRVKLPVHDFDKPRDDAPPTPRQKLLATISAHGDKPMELVGDVQPKDPQVSKGALIDNDDAVDPNMGKQPDADDQGNHDQDHHVDDQKDNEQPEGIVIPEDWATLSWNPARALARQIIPGTVVTNRDHAYKIIGEYVESLKGKE